MNIKLKIPLLLCLAVAVFFGVSILIVYLQWSDSLSAAAGQNNKESARLIASWVSDIIDREALKLCGARGEIAAGDLVQNESTGAWDLPLKIMTKNERGDVTYEDKGAVNIAAFFKPLDSFRTGKTGNAALIDDKSYLIYYPGTKPFVNKFCSYDDLQKVLGSKSVYALIDSAYLRAGRSFVAYERVGNPLLLNKGIEWFVVVSQDSSEVYRPLRELLPRASVTGIIFVIIAVFAGFVIGKLFLRPIEKLKDGMRRLGSGELDYRMGLPGRDEIGELTAAFNNMASELKNTTIPKTALDKEFAVKRRLEDRISRLTSEFTSAISQIRDLLPAVRSGTGIDKLSSEVENALELALAESGRMDLKISSSDIKALLKKIVFLYEPKIRGKGLDLKVDIPKGALDIQADADKITRVFHILLENVIKLTEKGRIEISIKELQSEAECTLAYTGALIPQDRFAAVSELAIAKTIIEMHNGKLWSESESPQISKLKFILPKQKKQ